MKALLFSDVQKNLEQCEKHLKDTETRGTDMESYLVRFLLVYICGKFEKEIERIVVERAEKSQDLELAQYVKGSFEPHRYLRVEALRGKILKKFSKRLADEFDKQVKDTKPEIHYSNIIANRNSRRPWRRTEHDF